MNLFSVSSCKKLCLSAALAMGFVSSAFSAEVILNSENITLPSADVTLVRTSATPEKVELQVPVAMTETVCTQYDTVTRSGYNAFHCGVDYYPVRVCRDDYICRQDRNGRQYCHYERRCYTETQSQPRFCSWQESVCVARAPQTSIQMKEAKLKFKNTELVGSETETYSLTSRQVRMDDGDVLYTVQALQVRAPVEIKRDGKKITIKNR